MIHNASKWWQKRVKQRLLVAKKLGQTSSPLGWIWMGRKIGSERNACAFVERRNPDPNKQRGGENVNERRYWWQERLSFTSSILTTSPTIGNGSAQVRERTQKFFELKWFPPVFRLPVDRGKQPPPQCVWSQVLCGRRRGLDQSEFVFDNLVCQVVPLKVLEIFYVGLSVRTSEVCRLTQKLAWVQWTLWRDKVRRIRCLQIYKILVN